MSGIGLLSCSHRYELIERHEISAQLAPDTDEFGRAWILSQACQAALRWCDTEGVAADVQTFARTDPATVGVAWSVPVVSAEACSLGEPFRFCWEPRWKAWFSRLGALQRGQTFAPTHPVVAQA